MNSMNEPANVAGARARCDQAETTLAHRRGELVAAVRDSVESFAVVESSIKTALQRLDDAEAEVSAAREAASIAWLTETADPVTHSEKSHHARVSALVAVHVMGAELVPGLSDVYRWRVRGVDGKVREVPNFTGDAGAIARAEAMLARNLRGIYGAKLVGIVTGCDSVQTPADAWAVACADPYLRSLALLETVRVQPTAEPPTLAQ